MALPLSNRMALLAAVGYVALVLAVYAQASLSIWQTWNSNDTFAHGILIPPIFFWLLWEKRQLLAKQPLVWQPLALLPVLMGVLLWQLSSAVGVLVGQQFAMVLILVSGIWAILGTEFCRAITFPLAFLFFGVPVGEFLIPHLMEFTASFTVSALRLSGIPVYREGLFFMLPTGSWSVVKACSGVRYLIASITLGALFAYLTYNSALKRVLFLLAAVLVPIIANGLRAYLIVLIGHHSNMELATGVDHLFYGWVFFGLVMLVLFSVGSIWREPQEALEVVAADSANEYQALWSRRALWMVPLLLGAATVGPVSQALSPDTVRAVAVDPARLLPNDANDWRRSDALVTQWKPLVVGTPVIAQAHYTNSKAESVQLYLTLYLEQSQDSEMVNVMNTVDDRNDESWRRVAASQQLVLSDAGQSLQFNETRMKSANTQVLIWDIYRPGNYYTNSDIKAKLIQVWNNAVQNRGDGTRIYLATKIEGDAARSRARMSAFVEEVLPAIEQSIEQVVESESH